MTTASGSASGDVVLQLSNLHGDIATQIPLVDSTTPVVNSYDEYGNLLPGTDPARYGWLGGKQRSTETPSGATLMGVRLYAPTTGRFLSVDPIPGGNANAYDYVNGDPLNRYDLDGKWGFHWRRWARRAGRFVSHHQTAVSVGLAFGCSFASGGWAAAGCAAGAGAVTGWLSYRYGTPKRKRHIGGYWASSWRGARDGLWGWSAGNGKKYVTGVRSAYRSFRTWRRGGHGGYTHIWPHY
jgi:RHS repeat-associated protein